MGKIPILKQQSFNISTHCIYIQPRLHLPQKGQNEGRMPVWIMMKVISTFSHNYGVVKTHQPGVHGFLSPKFVDLPLAWLLEREYDLFRMILNVLNWSFNSLKLFCRRRLDIVWWDLEKNPWSHPWKNPENPVVMMIVGFSAWWLSQASESQK